MTQMTYEEALSWIHAQLKFGIKPGIKRMKWLLEELGNPQDKVRGIHVVGTNGKGSTVSYLQHIFTETGYEVGTFTSPFIVDFRERISIDGEMISKDALAALANRLRPLAERLPRETDLETATEFELITVMMFLYFGQVHPVDIVVVEAGLGGRYDSTNVFSAMLLICPSIGLDHQDILGDSYAAIADQKAGALHQKEPFIYNAKRDDVTRVFEEAIKTQDSIGYAYGRDFKTTAEHGKLTFANNKTQLTDITLGMPGQHQVENASLAIQAALLLKETYPRLSDDAIRQGLKKTHWQGRTELITSQLMLDGAHNRESVSALVDVLKAYQDKSIHILLAAINTKPVDDMLEELRQVSQDVAVTTFDYPKAYTLEEYPSSYEKVSDWHTWVEEAASVKNDTDFYLVTGSLYFISQVRQYLLEKDD